MLIPEVRGDLLDGADNVICHGANCFNTMGAGVAAAIAKRYPGAAQVDKATTRGDPNKLGKFSVFQAPDGRLVYNLYTQYNYGRANLCYVDYNAIETALNFMVNDIQIKLEGQSYSIGLPKIGSGLGGGLWEVIKPIIDKVLADEPATIYFL